MTRTSHRAFAAVVLAGAMLSAIGCSKEITVTSYPPFYSEDLKTIAVVPFTNQTDREGAGDIISDKLAACLRSNGTYQTFNRGELKTILDERDLQIAFGGDSGEAAGKFRELGTVQALLTGTVSTYSASNHQEARQEPQYSINSSGQPYIAGYKTVTFTRNEGNVSVSAALIRVSDGATIFSTPGALVGQVASEGTPAQMDCNACVEAAANQVVAQLLENFAPVQKTIKIKPKDTVFLADGAKYDNEWPKTNEFSTDSQSAFLVVALPDYCDRNRFKVTIVVKDGREDLFSQDIAWTRGQNEMVMPINPSELAAKGGGPGKYEVKFYSGLEPVIRQTFTIDD